MLEEAIVLIVEDEPDLREILALTLEGSGCRVLCAGDGLEAIMMLEGHAASLVLCDVNMPNMNGLALLTEVRGRGNKVPFVFLSGDDSAYVDDVAQHMGASMLRKPFDMLAVRQVVKDQLAAQNAA